MRVLSEWETFGPFLPFRDAAGHWWWTVTGAERRKVVIDGHVHWQKRVRPETAEDWEARQW
jgi:hypothetical protein